MASVWTIQQVDARIAELRSSLAGVEEKLVELESDATRQLLATSSLAGATAAEWHSASADLELLWKWFLALTDALAATAERRGSQSSVSPRAARCPGGAALPPAPGRSWATNCWHGARAAADPSTAPTTLPELLAAMSASADRILAVVRRVEKVWDELVPRLSVLESSAVAVERLASEAGIRPPNDAAVARRLMGELRERCSADPLSIDGDPALDIDACLQRARAGTEQAIHDRRDLAAEISSALADLEQAAARLQQARAREGESALKIHGDSAGGLLVEIDAGRRRACAAARRVAPGAGAGRGRRGGGGAPCRRGAPAVAACARRGRAAVGGRRRRSGDAQRAARASGRLQGQGPGDRAR